MGAIKDFITRVRRYVSGGSVAESADPKARLNAQLDEWLYQSQRMSLAWLPLERDGLHYIWGNQLRYKSDGMDRVQSNYFFPALQQQLAFLSLRNTTITGVPSGQDDAAKVQAWSHYLQWLAEHSIGLKDLGLDCLNDGHSHGYWGVKVSRNEKWRWNETTKKWRGRTEVAVVRPETLIMDPYAESIKESRRRGTFRLMTVEEAIQRWPQFEKEIADAELGAPDYRILDTSVGAPWLPQVSKGVDIDQAPVPGERDGSRPGQPLEGRLAGLVLDPTGHMTPYVSASGLGTDSTAKRVVVYELFFHDDTEETVEESELIPMDELLATGQSVLQPDENGLLRYHDPATGEPYRGDHPSDTNRPVRKNKVTQPKYPNGRHILRFGTKQIVVDEAWPTKNWPIVVGRYVKIPHTWRGLNAVEIQRTLQDGVNNIDSHIVNYINNHSDAWIKYEEGSLAGAPKGAKIGDRMKSIRGLLVPCKTGQMEKVKRDSAPPMSDSLLKAREVVTSDLRTAIGMEDQGLGRSDRVTTATEALRAEQNSKVRTAMVGGSGLDPWAIEVMETVAQFEQHYLDPDELLSVVDDSGEVQQLMASELDTDIDLHLSLTITTDMPFDRERQRTDSAALYQMFPGRTTAQKVLDAYDCSETEKQAILGEMQQAAQAAAGVQPGAASPAMPTPTAPGGAGAVPQQPAAIGGI